MYARENARTLHTCLVLRTIFDGLFLAAVRPIKLVENLVDEVELLVEDHDWRELFGFDAPPRHGRVPHHVAAQLVEDVRHARDREHIVALKNRMHQLVPSTLRMHQLVRHLRHRRADELPREGLFVKHIETIVKRAHIAREALLALVPIAPRELHAARPELVELLVRRVDRVGEGLLLDEGLVCPGGVEGARDAADLCMPRLLAARVLHV
mmetsp:Transcript_9277/g.27593  ORF Transcript_9277/g.27593 Transcript_9277/m.27593 type:complete len:210 (-) Transcript_9277:332-961(-)